MIMNQARWQFRGASGIQGAEFAPDFLQAAGGSKLVAQLLQNRGIETVETAKAFLELESYTPTSGLELPDMPEAVERIMQALAKEEPILIFGDFDVDGQTGTSILVEALRTLNAKVSYYIPDRATEGHGLNATALCRMVSSRQIKLVISTDTGITNFTEVSLLKGLGVDTIITDHHELPENLPPSVANVNPKRLEDQEHPLAVLCGAGVAFKLAEAVLQSVDAPQSAIDALLDLTAIGTVADLVPLVKENRYLVYRGLQLINRRQRRGLREIMEHAGVAPEARATSETIGFTIGPRLNALGRLDNATEAVELLTTSNPEEARIIASRLEQLNRKRQEMCEKTWLEAEQYLNAVGGLGSNRTIILASPQWHLGIIGIVASRLIEKYRVPVFMMVVDEEKQQVRCSARSIPGFHIHDELLPLTEHFLGFGGHGGACGFSIELSKLNLIKEKLYAITAAKITEEQMLPVVDIDTKLAWPQLNTDLVNMIGALEPFGQENPSPRFLLEKVTIGAQRLLGAEGKHLKLVLTQGKETSPVDGLIWNFSSPEKFDASNTYQFVVKPQLNTFNNVTKVQLIIDAAKAEGSGAVAMQVAHKPTAASNPKPLATSNVAAADTETLWLDHRSRDAVESFVGQVMLPLQDARSIVFFHEGSKPNIPFLDEKIIVTRETLRPADELILWDLPPEHNQLAYLIDKIQPKTIHLVGGKYQTVPVFQQSKDYLKAVSMISKRHGKEPMSSLQFSSRLATTIPVVLSALILLNKMGVASTEVEHQETGRFFRISLNSEVQLSGLDTFRNSVELAAFEDHLKSVGDYRDWLLSSSLDTIKQSVRQGVHTYFEEKVLAVSHS